MYMTISNEKSIQQEKDTTDTTKTERRQSPQSFGDVDVDTYNGLTQKSIQMYPNKRRTSL